MKYIRPVLTLLMILTYTALIGSVLSSPAWAQFQEGGDVGGAELGESQTQYWKVGMQVTAVGGPCMKIIGYVPVPVDWPEQQVKVVEEDVSPQARISYKKIDKNMKLMVISVPQLPAGQTAHALITYEVTRSSQLPPEETDQFVFAKKRKLKGPMRLYLGSSPFIESRSAKIRKLAKEFGVSKTDKNEDGNKSEEEKELTAWEQVEEIYDWVREKVEYKEGDLKGALAALKDGTGDCEELSSLFIAICRAKDIPARTVWVPGHCYAEFYLEDAEGNGHWFPCQAAGSRAFGGIPEFRPVLQKGDNFRLPDDRKKRVRYLPERVTGAASKGKPRVKFIRETVAR